MICEHRLVVVDQFSDTADVLKAVFEPRGIEVERRRRPVAADSTGTSAELLVVDEDSVLSGDANSAQWSDAPRVVIGSASLPERTVKGHGASAYLSKPFEYSDLIRAIEQLLQPSGRTQPAREGSAFA